MNGNVIRTITIRGTSEGLDKVTADLNKLASAQENVAVVSEQSARRVLSLEDAWKRQTLKLDEAARAQANIARETKIADAALREGVATQAQHAQRLEQINQRYAATTTATKQFAQQTGLARHELINLGRQAQDVGVSLASGQSPLMVLVQQGTQIADVFATSGTTVRGFFSQATGWAGRFVTSTAGVVTGIGAIAAGAGYLASAWQESQREIQRTLLGIGRQSGVTIKDINEIAKTSATATGLSVGQAREAALEFVKTGVIFKDNIKAAVDVTHNFAIVTGQDATEAAKALGAAMANPLAGADALNKQIGFLDGRTREYIATLVSQNRNQEAQAVLLRNLAPAIQAATNALGPFEKAWDAVANAASRAKNAIGAALTPSTDRESVDKLIASRNQATANPNFGLIKGQPAVSSTDIRRMNEEIEQLLENLREVARAKALAFEEFKLPSLEADSAIRQLVPFIDQLKEADRLIAKINAAKVSPETQARMGLAEELEAAANAAQVLKLNLNDAKEAQARANEHALALTETYGTQSIETARSLDNLMGQLDVAQAVGGAARMEAQERATINQLLAQGKSYEDAIAIAGAQRALTQAQINAGAKETLFNLQQQAGVAQAVGAGAKLAAQEQATYNTLVHQGVSAELAAGVAAQERKNSHDAIQSAAMLTLENLRDQAGVAGAVTGAQRIGAQEAATYNRLLREGVDAWLAMEIAAQEAANAHAAATAEVYRQVHSLKQSTELIYARLNGTEATVKAQHAYTNAIRSGADEASAAAISSATLANETAKGAEAAMRLAAAWEQVARDMEYVAHISVSLGAKLFQSKQGGYSQFDPAGYTSSFWTPEYYQALDRYGEGGFDTQTGAPNAQGLEYAFNRTGSTGGLMTSPPTAVDIFGMPTTQYTPQLDTTKVSLRQRAIELLPQEQQAASIQQLLAEVQGTPKSLARDELVNSLIEKLEQLAQATDANTSATTAMTDVLSPFYSSDPRRTHLGFRAFAEGGIMTQYGELPLKHYQSGGIATSPQVAVFGEGSTPEAYVPAPGGQIPVVIKTPANSNQRPINVTINVMGSADASTVAALKQTSFQRVQQLRRIAG